MHRSSPEAFQESQVLDKGNEARYAPRVPKGGASPMGQSGLRT
jgi:hypothetical protein